MNPYEVSPRLVACALENCTRPAERDGRAQPMSARLS
jgi:hypothetical protein